MRGAPAETSDGGREGRKRETKERGVARHARWGNRKRANGWRGKREKIVVGRGRRETNGRRRELGGIGMREGTKKWG